MLADHYIVSVEGTIVSHGTVMTLFIARANGFDPVPFWQSLGLPAFAALSLPDLELIEVVRNVDDVKRDA